MGNQQPDDRPNQKVKAGRDAKVVGGNYTSIGVHRLKYMSLFTIINALLGLLAGIATSLLAVKELNLTPKPQPTSIEQPQPKRFP